MLLCVEQMGKIKKAGIHNRLFFELREQDSNLRPSGYEPDELPTAPSRDIGLQR